MFKTFKNKDNNNNNNKKKKEKSCNKWSTARREGKNTFRQYVHWRTQTCCHGQPGLPVTCAGSRADRLQAPPSFCLSFSRSLATVNKGSLRWRSLEVSRSVAGMHPRHSHPLQTHTHWLHPNVTPSSRPLPQDFTNVSLLRDWLTHARSASGGVTLGFSQWLAAAVCGLPMATHTSEAPGVKGRHPPLVSLSASRLCFSVNTWGCFCVRM